MDFKRKLVALHGLPGVGKDTLADLLVARRGYTKLAFADPVYAEVAAVMSTTESLLRSRAAKTEPVNSLALFHSADPEYRRFMVETRGEDIMSPRTSRYHMDHYGTDYCRHIGDPLRWVRATMAAAVTAGTDVVVSDLRGYKDAREISALKTFSAQCSRPLCVVEVCRDVQAPSNHEAHLRLPQHAIDVRLDATTGDIESTFFNLLESLSLWFGDD